MRTAVIHIGPGHNNHLGSRRICRGGAVVWNVSMFALRHIHFDNRDAIAAYRKENNIPEGTKLTADEIEALNLKPFLSPEQLDKFIRTDKPQPYARLSPTSARETVYAARDAVSVWLKQLRSFNANPALWEKRPRMPGYSDYYHTVEFGTNAFRVRNGWLKLAVPESINFPEICIQHIFGGSQNYSKGLTVIRRLFLTPNGHSFNLGVVYDAKALQEWKEKHEPANKKKGRKYRTTVSGQGQSSSGVAQPAASCEKEKSSAAPTAPIIPLNLDYDVILDLSRDRICAVDMGVDNFATAVSMETGFPTIIIKGKAIKSINRFWNKEVAELRTLGKDVHVNAKTSKRKCRINDFLHKASRFLVNFAHARGDTVIVFGKNKGWKKRVKLGRKTNQKFVQIPYDRFIAMVKYKAAELGIRVYETEESYTSKASAID